MHCKIRRRINCGCDTMAQFGNCTSRKHCVVQHRSSRSFKVRSETQLPCISALSSRCPILFDLVKKALCLSVVDEMVPNGLKNLVEALGQGSF